MRVLIFFIALGMAACTRSVSPVCGKQKLANEIRGKVAYQMKQEANLRPCGTMGQMLNEIQILGLSFAYYKPVDIVEGRKLLVKCVEAMLQEINADSRIRPYLIRYPFKPRNVNIEIFVKNPDGTSVSPGILKILDASEGVLRYEIDTPDKSRFITVYKETYQEALDRIADPSLPLASFQPDKKLSAEDLAQLRKGIYFMADDGSVYQPDEKGSWTKKTL